MAKKYLDKLTELMEKIDSTYPQMQGIILHIGGPSHKPIRPDPLYRI